MSLWKVPVATAVLMDRFYSNLLDCRLVRDEALRHAQTDIARCHDCRTPRRQGRSAMREYAVAPIHDSGVVMRHVGPCPVSWSAQIEMRFV